MPIDTSGAERPGSSSSARSRCRFPVFQEPDPDEQIATVGVAFRFVERFGTPGCIGTIVGRDGCVKVGASPPEIAPKLLLDRSTAWAESTNAGLVRVGTGSQQLNVLDQLRLARSFVVEHQKVDQRPGLGIQGAGTRMLVVAGRFRTGGKQLIERQLWSSSDLAKVVADRPAQRSRLPVRGRFKGAVVLRQPFAEPERCPKHTIVHQSVGIVMEERSPGIVTAVPVRGH